VYNSAPYTIQVFGFNMAPFTNWQFPVDENILANDVIDINYRIQSCHINNFTNFATYPKEYTLWIDVGLDDKNNNKLSFKFPELGDEWMQEHNLHLWGVE